MKGLDRDTSILIVGLGSIGQRHLRNLHHLGYRELYAVSSGKGTMPTADLPIQEMSENLENALDRFKPQVVFVCNPTSMHISTAISAAKTGAHIFMEKPIAVNWQGIQELSDLVKISGLKLALGFQFRQHPVLQSICNLIRNGRLGKIHSVRMHWGEYLPAWHPWEDYKKSYSAVEGLGGGVTCTLCHPFDYLRWMLGDPHSVQASIKNTGELGIETDDVHMSTWEFKNGTIATVHLDYLERPPSHKLTVIGIDAKVEWCVESGTATLFDKGREAVKICTDNKFDRNDLFMAELREFLDCIANDQQPSCNLLDGQANLKMILASKQSSELGRAVLISDVKLDGE